MAKGKSFGWTEAEKEEYYKKAEKIVEGIDGIEIDRDQFGVRGQSEFAIVHIKRVLLSNDLKTVRKLKKIKNFHEVTNIYKGEYGYNVKGIFYNGYFVIPMGGEKENVRKTEKRSNRAGERDSMVHVS